MAEIVSIKVDLDEIKRGLQEFENEAPYLEADILQKVGQGAVRAAKRGYGNALEKKSGKLYRGIKYKVNKNKHLVTIASYAAHIDRYNKSVKYGFALARGATIKAKHHKTLVFQIGGKWIREQSVLLKRYDWLSPPINQYLAGSDYDADIQKGIDKSIAKLKRKGVIA